MDSKRVGSKIGAGVDFLNDTELFGREPNERTDTAERGYEEYAGTNTRGYGTALTYIYAGERYWGGNWNTRLKPFAFWELGINLSKSASLNFGARANESILYISNGWDRYDALQTLGKHTAADYLVVSPYIALHFKLGDSDGRRARISR